MQEEEDEDSSSDRDRRDGPRRKVIVPWPTAETLSTDHFINFPLDRIKVDSTAFLNMAGVSSSAARVNQQVGIVAEFTNRQAISQDYTLIVQVTYEKGIVTSIATQKGMIESGGTAERSSVWTPEKAGLHTVQMFVWDGISDTSQPLASVNVKRISVTES